MSKFLLTALYLSLLLALLYQPIRIPDDENHINENLLPAKEINELHQAAVQKKARQRNFSLSDSTSSLLSIPSKGNLLNTQSKIVSR